MYDIYIRPLNYQHDIFIGYCYSKNTDVLINSIKMELNQSIDMRGDTLLKKYKTRYYNVKLLDSYNNDEEVLSVVYDSENNEIISEEV